MHSLSNKPRPDSESSSSGDSGWSQNVDWWKSDRQNIINQANTIPILRATEYYGHRIDDYNRRIRCPFHKGGNEKTPSFWVYPETNSFHCFGCKASGKIVDFVAKSESITKLEASIFCIEKWGSFLKTDVDDFKETKENQYLIDFSIFVRNFLNQNPASLEYVEKLTFGFDQIRQKYRLDDHKLLILIDKIKKRIESFEFGIEDSE